MPSDPKTKTRVRLAFLSLIVAFAVGAYFVSGLGRLQDDISARESRAALQGLTEPGQIEQAVRQHPSNRLLQMIAMAGRAAEETDAAVERILDEVEPPSLAREVDLGKAARADLEALRRELKTAQANATVLGPRVGAVLASERDKVKSHALALRIGEPVVTGLLDVVDRRHAEITALMTKTSSARADYYRARENYIGMLAAEAGTYKVVDGQFIFPFQRTVDRYNVAANAMTAASERVAALNEDRKNQTQAAQARWLRFVNSL